MDAVRDGRQRPQIRTGVIMRAAAVMFLCRLGSLHALEQSKPSGVWRGWLGRELPSADTIGRVCALADPDDIRALHHHVYTRLKRMKALPPPEHGLMAAVLDGHESHATFRRCCPGCLQRLIHTNGGDRIQYYHRHVGLALVGGDSYLLLDAEPQRPGGDEVAAALRLFRRFREAYPRAFDVLVVDALYADSRVFNDVLSEGKDVIAVLKQDRRDLYQDAQTLIGQTAPVALHRRDGYEQVCWDIEGFTSWPQVSQPVRIVRSLETRHVRRQRDGTYETTQSDWLWVTTLSQTRASTETVVKLGHSRWTIENEGFNEMVNRWHADHVYKHQPTAILVLWLLAMVCLNLFLAFYRRNLKPARRHAASMLHISRQIAAELYSRIPSGRSWAPT